MLLSYSLSATLENWLHDAILEILGNIHAKIDAGDLVFSWDELIPNTLLPNLRQQIKGRHGLKSRVNNYQIAVLGLSIAQRAIINQVMHQQNDIAGLVSGTSPISSLKFSFPAVHDVVSDLFIFAYEALPELGVRDRQYKLIFEALGVKTCPFCNIERIMSPQETRQDQDHYLAKSIYPFAAVNMRNLVPMCRCCNRDYKHDIDVLIGFGKQRRRAFDPYQAPGVGISLNKSIPFQGIDSMPAWWVDFVPASEESETWDQVFSIRTRYSRDVLNQGFGRWIGSFSTRCRQMRHPKTITDQEVYDILKAHHEIVVIEKPAGIDFLKPQVFEMLLNYFNAGHVRVIKFIRDAVVGI